MKRYWVEKSIRFHAHEKGSTDEFYVAEKVDVTNSDGMFIGTHTEFVTGPFETENVAQSVADQMNSRRHGQSS